MASFKKLPLQQASRPDIATSGGPTQVAQSAQTPMPLTWPGSPAWAAASSYQSSGAGNAFALAQVADRAPDTLSSTSVDQGAFQKEPWGKWDFLQELMQRSCYPFPSLPWCEDKGGGQSLPAKQPPLSFATADLGGGTYTVESGDTLSRDIFPQSYQYPDTAGIVGLTRNAPPDENQFYTDLIAENNGVSPSTLKIGQTLDLPVVQQLMPVFGADVSALPEDPYSVPFGQLTFDSEAASQQAEESGNLTSLGLHWPGGESGVTIGAGYDLKGRAPETIMTQLQLAGIDPEIAKSIALGSGLEDDSAVSFVNGHPEILITPEQQQLLFVQEYQRKMLELTERLTRWESEPSESGSGTTLDPRLTDLSQAEIELLMDLTYRGDLEPSTWTMLSEPILNHDQAALEAIMCDPTKWPKVIKQAPKRFQDRCEFVQDLGQPETQTEHAASVDPIS